VATEAKEGTKGCSSKPSKWKAWGTVQGISLLGQTLITKRLQFVQLNRYAKSKAKLRFRHHTSSRGKQKEKKEEERPQLGNVGNSPE